eukprot:TRINITY_DN4221_c0_g1_i2.p1 TRINITY_DN4221_c0_g1~~TRINITY_DN4221_c0_g1_i2.p1  ORF type:complete len:161 (-),score=17.51 TRINITY_DN4221_c0_g1_i2:184-621(-)
MGSKKRVVVKSTNVTAFQRRVYDAICKIPAGRITTYKLLAQYLKCDSTQGNFTALAEHHIAVGQALRRNPFAPQVPCHRVIKTTLSIGGYSGETDVSGDTLQRKLALLKTEGLTFTSEYKLAPKHHSQLFYFTAKDLEGQLQQCP